MSPACDLRPHPESGAQRHSLSLSFFPSSSTIPSASSQGLTPIRPRPPASLTVLGLVPPTLSRSLGDDGPVVPVEYE